MSKDEMMERVERIRELPDKLMEKFADRIEGAAEAVAVMRDEKK